MGISVLYGFICFGIHNKMNIYKYDIHILVELSYENKLDQEAVFKFNTYLSEKLEKVLMEISSNNVEFKEIEIKVKENYEA